MTIYGSGYRPWDGARAPRWAAYWALTRVTIRTPFRKKIGLLAYMVILFPALASLAIFFAISGILPLGFEGRMELPGFDPSSTEFYLDRVLPGFFRVFAVALTAWICCRVIARDRSAQALETLWTRDLSPLGYFCARWAGGALLLAGPTLGAQIVLFLAAVSTSSQDGFFLDTLPVFLRCFAATTVFVALMSGLPTALSAVVSRADLAAVLWAAFTLGGQVFGELLKGILPNSEFVRSIGPVSALRRITDSLAGLEVPSNELMGSLFIIGLPTLLIGYSATRRLRTTEVFG